MCNLLSTVGYDSGLLETRRLSSAIVRHPTLGQDHASPTSGISVPCTEDHEAFGVIDKGPTPLPIAAGRPHGFDKFSACHSFMSC